jgi:hypothetical protein
VPSSKAGTIEVCKALALTAAGTGSCMGNTSSATPGNDYTQDKDGLPKEPRSRSCATRPSRAARRNGTPLSIAATGGVDFGAKIRAPLDPRARGEHVVEDALIEAWIGRSFSGARSSHRMRRRSRDSRGVLVDEHVGAAEEPGPHLPALGTAQIEGAAALRAVVDDHR